MNHTHHYRNVPQSLKGADKIRAFNVPRPSKEEVEQALEKAKRVKYNQETRLKLEHL